MNEGILIDIDGTICDSRVPISFLNGEKDTNNFPIYYRLCSLVTPYKNIIEDICTKCYGNVNGNLTIKDITLVFLTGRTAERHVMNDTMEFIEQNFGNMFKFSQIKADFYFRPINYHCSSREYKLAKFTALKNLYDFSHIYEDEFLNVGMFNEYKQDNCKVHWVKNPYNFALESQGEVTNNVSSDIIIHQI